MTRTLTILVLGALAVAASACGSASPPVAESPMPDTGSGPGSAAVSTCKTPEGATRESPPVCPADCVFDAEQVKCIEQNRGIIVNQ